MNREFGIIGKPLSHSFSPTFFSEKFGRLKLDNHVYKLYELDKIEAFQKLIRSEKNLVGLNVTIPFKQSVIPYLDKVDSAALAIGAVNTIVVSKGQTKGYNTDVVGFTQTLKSLNLKSSKFLILGNGGVSKAVQWVLNRQNKPFTVVSTRPGLSVLGYGQLPLSTFQSHLHIVNCTSLGMHPHINTLPKISYKNLTDQHTLIDLVYNPRVTAFLHQGIKRGCRVKNGFEMLVTQAEASWKLWKVA